MFLILRQVCGAASNAGVPPQSTAIPHAPIPQAGRLLLGIHTQLLSVAAIHLCKYEAEQKNTLVQVIQVGGRMTKQGLYLKTDISQDNGLI